MQRTALRAAADAERYITYNNCSKMKQYIGKIVLLYFLGFNCIGNISCSDNPVAPEISNLYFPVQLGNSWTYELSYYDTVQKFKNVTYSITKSKIIDGKEFYAFDNWPEFIYFPLAHYFNMDSVFIRDDENGNVVMIAENNEFMFIEFDPSLVGEEIDILELYDDVTQNQSKWQSVIYDADRELETKDRKYTNGYRIRLWEYNWVGSQRDIILFKGFGITRMSYIAYSMDWKLIEATINGKKVDKIVKYPEF